MPLHSRFRRSPGSERIGVLPEFRSTWRHKRHTLVQWAGGDFPFSPIPFVGYLSEVVLGPIWGSDPWVFPKFDAFHSSSRLPQAHSMWLRNP